jgi:uncharacterized protein
VSEAVETVRELYRAFAQRDSETIRRIFDPEIEWNQMDGWPNGGRYVGTDQVLNQVFAKFRAHWDEWGAEVDEYLDAGGVVIALGHYSGRGKRTGKAVRAAFAHVYTLRSGQIVKFVQYADTYRVVEGL